MIDYHVHSTHSADAESTMLEQCRRAVEVGVDEIGFTDHLDFCPTDTCYEHLNYDAFMRDIDEARRIFNGSLVIRAGIEIDYRTEYHERIENWLRGKQFDYIVGSAHYVNGIILENHEKYFPGKTPLEAYLPYFDVTESVIRSGLFDILAHMDLCKRHGSRYYGALPLEQLSPRIKQLLKLVIDAGMVLEVNTSGLRQAPKDTYPSMDIVRLYRKFGGTCISLGSDAHRASDLASGIQETIIKLKSACIADIACFGDRKRISRSL